MINPYTFYILGFVFSLAVYQLDWSEIYPPLSIALVVFLISTIACHFLMSRWWIKTESRYAVERNRLVHPLINPWVVTVTLYVCWAVDFIHEGGIPLVNIMLNIPYDYKAFGTPSLHVFAVTFSSFFCIYLLSLYFTNRRTSYLFLYVVNMGSAILIYSRSMLLFNLSSSIFLYLLSVRKVPYSKFLLGTPLCIVLFYLFGVVGTVRVSYEAKTHYDENSFLDTGKANDYFRNSGIPKEFFWPYIYISSPVGNLQVNINTHPIKPITLKRVLEYINNEWLFESFSKRINKLFDVERETENTINKPFNVSTGYSRSYSYLGWTGVIAMAIFLLIVPAAYRELMVNNPYRTISMAILCTTYLFLAYDNTIRLMALGFQLVYPLVFPIVENKLSKLRQHV